MSYSDFTIDELKQQLGLQLDEATDLFSGVAPVPIGSLLTEILRENVPLALAISTEKARSEMIIAPVLIELRRQMGNAISLFSGAEFNVDAAAGLKGVCDYLVSLSPEQLTITAPVLMVVEAKNENIKGGLAQCMAEMVAAQRFNQQRGRPLPAIHGVVTTGSVWRFLRLVGSVAVVDVVEYYLREIDRLVGILVYIVNSQRGAMVG